MQQDVHAARGFRPGRFGTALGLIAGLLVFNSQAGAHAGGHVEAPRTEAKTKAILADVEILERLGIEVLAAEPSVGVGFAHIDSKQEARLSQLAHELGRCGGFEALPASPHEPNLLTYQHAFGQLAEQAAKNRRFRMSTNAFAEVTPRAEIQSAIEQVSEENLRASVEFLSGHETRLHKGPKANEPILAFKQRIEQTLQGASVNYEVELVSHSSTEQKSIRVRVPGAVRPSEIIVLGGHIDSINHEWFGTKTAPGADDNASGSANLLEALRILSRQPQPERTIEFYWYAGEEGGLLGSAEIAREYKAQSKDVIAVLQLDMTLFPGDGEFVLGSMTDFTSAWLRGYLETINGLYIKARIVSDKCGYGCSDHASWHRQGFPALMPFEASFRGMNKSIHSSKDVIDGRSSFKHSAMFSKIALTIAMDLGNSELREPK